MRGTDLNVAKRRDLGRLSSCSGEGGSQMGGGENTLEHRKVEAVGVGWESVPCPRLRAFDQIPGGVGESFPETGKGGRATVGKQVPQGALA